ncbi:MAG: HAMP domain-containing histidine kinase [Crocinitomicaceae bacterium]|nr:HAMP domain-containing histidine kinase [Crocinitomicaceae bacterium]
MRRHVRNPLFLFYLLVIYIVTQFSWWLYLIASLYGKIYTDPNLLEKKTLMLVGEGTVFVIILFGGVFMIKRAYKKENDLNKLQENFLLSVSHELKTPISSVTLFLQTLQKRDLPEAKREEIYNQSLTEIKRLESLVSNILITRSIENKNYFLNKSDIQLNELIQHTLDALQKTALKNHSVESELESCTLSADRESFVSIITNLLQNAAKYSPPGSEIKIKLQKKNQTLTLEISDQGIGIPDAKKALAFTRFYRDENEMTRKSKGTGLGLFITKFLVEQHGGSIELKDNTPQGLRVTIKFNAQ